MDSLRSEPITIHRTPPGLNRRHAMALMAASLALAGGACTRAPRERIHPWVHMPEARSSGVPVYYASAFVRDGYALGTLVGTQDGRPIKIEGNPLHPSSLGATDVFAQASVLELWDPDRSATVMQRLVASRAGDAPAAASSWSAFEAAWLTRSTQLRLREGEGLRVLTGPLTSPTLRAQLARLMRRFPRARWHQQTPPQGVSARDGAIAAFGRPVQPVWHIDRAQCVVALAADPFAEGPGAVRHAADWSLQRRLAARSGAAMARLMAVEVSPGLFGARADDRIALPPAEIDALVQRLAARLIDGTVPSDAPVATTAHFEAHAAQALRAAGPAGLVVAGAPLSPASHAAVHAIHQRLGATGHALDLIDALSIAPEAASLSELVDAMSAGAVDTLFILDANPLYDAPAAPRVAAGLAQVRSSVHMGLYRDETALACDWHLPLSHGLEQWSDALGHDGSATLVQPAIAPLYDSRSLHELLALLVDDELREDHALLQRQWRARAGADFDAFWRESLRRGVVAGTAAPPLALAAGRRVAEPPAPAAGTIAAVFATDPSVHDGRYANNAWLQELPRSFTKLTWDNALLIGPATARSLGVTTGDVLRASVDGRRLDMPAWVLSSHAEGAVTLPLGYGRRAAGRVGTGVGFDARGLRTSDAVVAAVRLESTGHRHEFAVTQHTMDASGRALARTLRAGARIDDPSRAAPSLYPPAPADAAHAWAMAIDLDACIGCNACTIACQAENNIPVVGKAEVARGRAMHWIRVDRYELPELAGSIFQPVPCMHCENAPCELVCPVGATMHDSEGLNVQVYNRCIGTRFCSNNCPYKVRRFNFLQYTDATTETLKGQRNPNVTVRQRGVMEKCTYCLQRITRARQLSLASGMPLADGDVITACQAACPTRAIHFGDLRDPAAAIVAVRQSPRHYALLGELNTRPRTTYLARIRAEDDER